MTRHAEVQEDQVNQAAKIDKQFQDYLRYQPRLSDAWKDYARKVIFQVNHHTLDESDVNSSTRSQADSFDITPKEKAVYRQMTTNRELVPPIFTSKSNTGAHPSGITDERLAVEICLLMGDKKRAKVIITQHPSLSLPIAPQH